MIHADDQLGLVEDAIRGLIDTYVPEPLRDGFVFHASDLYNGRNLPPELQSEEIRIGILKQLVSLPKRLNLLVCFGSVWKEKFREFNRCDGMDTQRVNVAIHAAAIAECTVSAEDLMRARAKNEVAALFAENNNEVRCAARETQILMRSAGGSQRLSLVRMNHLLPLKHVKDGINFVTKKESLALQLADACAWTIRKRFTKDPKARLFFDLLDPAILGYTVTSMDAAARL